MELHPIPAPDPLWGTEYARDEQMRWVVMPQFGGQVVLHGVACDARPGDSATYGWMYRDLELAVMALALWDPDVHDEPLYFNRRAQVRERREAPHRDTEPTYNRPRCIHGHYIHAGACPTNLQCEHEDPQRLEAAGKSSAPVLIQRSAPATAGPALPPKE